MKTYSSAEAVELIAQADNMEELKNISAILELDKREYPLTEVEILKALLLSKTGELGRRDAKELKEFLKQFGL